MIIQISKIEINMKTSKWYEKSISGMMAFKIVEESSIDCGRIWIDIGAAEPDYLKDTQYNNLTEMLK